MSQNKFQPNDTVQIIDLSVAAGAPVLGMVISFMYPGNNDNTPVYLVNVQDGTPTGTNGYFSEGDLAASGQSLDQLKAVKEAKHV